MSKEMQRIGDQIQAKQSLLKKAQWAKTKQGKDVQLGISRARMGADGVTAWYAYVLHGMHAVEVCVPV